MVEKAKKKREHDNEAQKMEWKEQNGTKGHKKEKVTKRQKWTKMNRTEWKDKNRKSRFKCQVQNKRRKERKSYVYCCCYKNKC